MPPGLSAVDVTARSIFLGLGGYTTHRVGRFDYACLKKKKCTIHLKIKHFVCPAITGDRRFYQRGRKR